MQCRIFILLLPFCSNFVISLESLDVGCVQENQCKDFPPYCCPQGYCCKFWTHTQPGVDLSQLSSRCVLLTEKNDGPKLCEQKLTVPAHKAKDFNEPVERRKCTEFDKMMGYYCIDGPKTKRESVTGDPFMWMQQEMGVQNKMVLDAMLKKRKPKV